MNKVETSIFLSATYFSALASACFKLVFGSRVSAANRTVARQQPIKKVKMILHVIGKSRFSVGKFKFSVGKIGFIKGYFVFSKGFFAFIQGYLAFTQGVFGVSKGYFGVSKGFFASSKGYFGFSKGFFAFIQRYFGFIEGKNQAKKRVFFEVFACLSRIGCPYQWQKY